MYHIYFYAPKTHATNIKNAMFGAGAGKIGDYSHCAWQTKGTGQFYPESGSQPFAGQAETLETIEEYKIEMVCEDHLIENVIDALKRAHPYETPAYGVIPLHDTQR